MTGWGLSWQSRSISALALRLWEKRRRRPILFSHITVWTDIA
jgi:hypothetical protein